MSLALFDFDGTITWSDTWTPFMRFAVRPSRLLIGQVVMLPIVVGYKLGAVSASSARQAAARAGFRGEDADVVRRRGVEYATNVIPGTLRQSALDRIDWHKSHGDRIVIVSAALDIYLGPWCERRGLEYICTTLEEQGGRLTGRYAQGDCSCAEKARRIRERCAPADYELVYAYGDSSEDREMLEMAHRKYYRWREIRNWREVAAG